MRLPLVRDTLQLDVFLAALAISTVLPIAMFIVFRRFFLSGDALRGCRNSALFCMNMRAGE